MILIVLAGGQGTRLWPLSQPSCPKQFLPLLNYKSLLGLTLSRFANLERLQEIVIVTHRNYDSLVHEQLEKTSCKAAVHVLTEPESKNTAPAITYALQFIRDELSINQNTPVMVVPSDHYLSPTGPFIKAIEGVIPTLSNNIVTFGIKPRKPETGYGYIEFGEKLSEYHCAVTRFIEKPNYLKAQEIFASNYFLWNSGMFLFTSKTFFKELEKYQTRIYSLSQEKFSNMNQRFNNYPEISIDYALMEKTKHVVVCPLNDIVWSDLGSWDSLYEILDKDENGNVIQGNVTAYQTHNSMIFARKKLISTSDISDIFIIETEDAIYVGKKGNSQNVKQLLKEIKKKTSAIC